jgi:hypothetical protein
MSKKRKLLDPLIKDLIGFEIEDPDDEVMRKWKEASNRVCKPCWELRYCPYGSLVEQFPLIPPTRSSATEHNEYLKMCLETGKLSDGSQLEEWRREMFEEDVKRFDPLNYPEHIPQEILDMECNVFGHICPVVFTGTAFTETSESRRMGRYIPFKTKIRVVRRDNHTCQNCGKHLKDDEVEFDHVIPISRGGSSEEHNIRLTCHDCNSDKGDRVEI